MRKIVPEGGIFAKDFDVAFDMKPLAVQIFGNGIAEGSIGDPVGAVGAGGQVAACELVLALRACLDARNAARNGEVDRLIVAAFEMQEGVMLDRAHLDHGKLTDHNGKKIDFRNVVLIMTTNAGASEAAKNAIGFGGGKRVGEDEDAIKRLFTPEFRNRLDAVIPFAPLTPEIIAHVVEKFVLQLDAQLADRNVTISLTPEANAWLAKRGYDDQMGARPLARVIQESIKKPLADEVLFGRLLKGGHVVVKVGEGDTLVFDIEEAITRTPPPPKRRGAGDDSGSTPRVPLLVE